MSCEITAEYLNDDMTIHTTLFILNHRPGDSIDLSDLQLTR